MRNLFNVLPIIYFVALFINLTHFENHEKNQHFSILAKKSKFSYQKSSKIAIFHFLFLFIFVSKNDDILSKNIFFLIFFEKIMNNLFQVLQIIYFGALFINLKHLENHEKIKIFNFS